MQKYKKRLICLLSDKPVSRSYLSNQLQLSDRTVRQLISELRNQGIPICSNSRTGGYWIAKDKDEIQQTINEYRHRAFNMLITARKIERNELLGQMEIKMP